MAHRIEYDWRPDHEADEDSPMPEEPQEPQEPEDGEPEDSGEGEGEGEGEDAPEGEGEGEGEGKPDGGKPTNGKPQGTPQGTSESGGKGNPEGKPESKPEDAPEPEGEGEGEPEGEPEGEGEGEGEDAPADGDAPEGEGESEGEATGGIKEIQDEAGSLDLDSMIKEFNDLAATETKAPEGASFSSGGGGEEFATYDPANHSSDRSMKSLASELFARLAEDAAGEETDGDEFWDVQRLMTRRARGATPLSCRMDRHRESIVILVDNSGSCEPQERMFRSFVQAAFEVGDVEVWQCPNGRLTGKVNPETGKVERGAYMRYMQEPGSYPSGDGWQWLPLKDRVVIYLTDYDGVSAIKANQNWCRKLYWFNAANYGEIFHEQEDGDVKRMCAYGHTTKSRKAFYTHLERMHDEAWKRAEYDANEGVTPTSWSYAPDGLAPQWFKGGFHLVITKAHIEIAIRKLKVLV